MNLKRVFREIGKSFLVFLIGGVLGIVVSLLYLFWFWLPTEGHKVGLGIIGVFPVMMVLFSFMGLVVGGVIGVVGYWVVRLVKQEFIEPRLRPEYVKKIKNIEKGKFKNYKTLSALRKDRK